MGRLISTPLDELTYKIIGCAMAVHRKMGPGYPEKIYQRDLEVYFSESNLSFEAQKHYEVYNSLLAEQLIGYYIADFVIEETVILEIKSLKALESRHLVQVIGYLAVSKCPIGLLINFGERSLKYHRVLPPKNLSEHQVNRQWLFVPEWMKEKHK